MNDKKKPKPIDIENFDLDQMKSKTTDIPGLLEYAHSVGGFKVVPTEKGMIRSRSLNAMEEQTQKQMDQIFEQMKLLASQAKEVQERANISMQIYNADISFQPIIGETYHLYEKEDGKKVVSMIGPNEWGSSMPFEKFISSIKLLSDHTWDVTS